MLTHPSGMIPMSNFLRSSECDDEAPIKECQFFVWRFLVKWSDKDNCIVDNVQFYNGSIS